MAMQGILREEDYVERFEEVSYEEISKKTPRRATKTYQKNVGVQMEFVRYWIDRFRTLNNDKPAGTKVKYPIIFPDNAEILPEALKLVENEGFKLFSKLVNDYRVAYFLEGTVGQK